MIQQGTDRSIVNNAASVHRHGLQVVEGEGESRPACQPALRATRPAPCVCLHITITRAASNWPTSADTRVENLSDDSKGRKVQFRPVRTADLHSRYGRPKPKTKWTAKELGRRILRFLLSEIGLVAAATWNTDRTLALVQVFVVIGYCVFGGWLFQCIEGDAEMARFNHVRAIAFDIDV